MAEMLSISSAFFEAARRWADRPFLHAPAGAIDAEAPFSVSYGEAREAVERLQLAYGAAGIGVGCRVATMLDNHPAFFLHLIALNGLGASLVPLNAAASAGEIAGLLLSSEPVLAIAWPRHGALIESAMVEAGWSLPIVAPDAPLPQIADAKAATTPCGNAEAAMLFTSGTTGKPKGCILSNAYFMEAGALYNRLGGLCALKPGGERILTPLPVTHMNALAVSFMASILAGACLIQLDRFHASDWWETVRETGATVIHYLGVMPAILLQLPVDERDTEHQVRFGFGAGVDPVHHARFEERFGFPLVEAWAMTETGGGAWITASHEPRHVGSRCFGRVPPEMEIRLVDEQGVDVPDGLPGELLVRRAGADPRRFFFSAYHKDPAATEEAWADGWFHTGDVVRRGPDGSLFFVDRNKNIVRRSGENIAAVEVEAALLRHPAVGAVAVLPVSDEIRGEEVMALVVLADPAGSQDAELAEALVRHGLDLLVYFKTPGYVAFVDTLPTTASQKMQRGEIRTLGRSLLAKGKAYDFRHLKRKGKAAA